MRITIQVGGTGSPERKVEVLISAEELAAVHLHLAFPEGRNRTGRYMRRHACSAGESVDPNRPVRLPEEPPKLPIPAHIEQMRRAGTIPPHPETRREGGMVFGSEPTMVAVPLSDPVANLLRPCFHRDGLGGHRLFFLEGEPIENRSYWCACFFHDEKRGPRLDLCELRFDAGKDRALDTSGSDLVDRGLVWAAALVPLVVDGRALSAVEIARNNYDLRQIFGRQADEEIKHVYEGWFDEWDDRVEEVVSQHERNNRPYEAFYHSILGLDGADGIHIRQVEGRLPELAASLAHDGIVAAGVIDSGGSSALYDVWMASYLNHGWYFREPRGGVLVFELRSSQRIPDDREGSWIHRRRKVEQCKPSS